MKNRRRGARVLAPFDKTTMDNLKKNLGDEVSPMSRADYIDTRLNAIKFYTDYSIKDFAFACGYSRPDYISQCRRGLTVIGHGTASKFHIVTHGFIDRDVLMKLNS